MLRTGKAQRGCLSKCLIHASKTSQYSGTQKEQHQHRSLSNMAVFFFKSCHTRTLLRMSNVHVLCRILHHTCKTCHNIITSPPLQFTVSHNQSTLVVLQFSHDESEQYWNQWGLHFLLRFLGWLGNQRIHNYLE